MNGVGTPADDGSRYRATEGCVIKTEIKAGANILSGLPPGCLGMITLAPS